MRRWARWCASLLIVGVFACATPTERFDRRAAALGFETVTLQGKGFRHLAYIGGISERSDTLHVYVEHDGTPWVGRTRVTDDPTPRTPFALELMARDAGPRLLLGRPCHFESESDSGCGPLLWTHRRYSPEVVASMVAALRSFLALHSYRRLVLIGYSGGGTIAWLMAASLPETTMVVTVAANLDTDGWARIHGYSALEGSLNPALLPELRPAIVQLHYVGGRDRNVPPSIVRAFARHHPRARVVEIADFDHVCCWIERWPRLLAEPATSLMPTTFAHDTCRPTSGIASTVAILSERLSCRVGSMMPKRAIEKRAPSRPALLARSRPGSVCGSIAARSNHAGATDGANG